MRPKFLGGDVPEIKGESRREVLAHWLTSPQNPQLKDFLKNCTEPEPVLEDVFWSLLNAKEFVFNH